jgi:protein gp37
MSGIHKTKIEWADATHNPVSGCLHDCPYCYARNTTRRFQPKPSEWPEEGTIVPTAHDDRCFVAIKPTVLRDSDGKYLRSTPYPKGFAPTMHRYKLTHLHHAITPRRIFVGSMTDLFGDWVPDE